jgi:hypothetical protein
MWLPAENHRKMFSALKGEKDSKISSQKVKSTLYCVWKGKTNERFRGIMK